jgi:hypothetical protein
LDPDQLERLNPVLDDCRKTNNYEGILCSLSRAYSPASNCITVEFQLIKLDRKGVAAFKKILRGT